MARHPEWFERLDVILDLVRASDVEWLGRPEIKALFGASDRDAIRLLHKFGAAQHENALSLPRPALLIQLEAVRRGSTFARFLGQRHGVAKQLATARAETAARQFRVRSAPVEEHVARLEDLPKTITWRRESSDGPARFEILYDDGADLMWQLSEFLSAAGVNRTEFFEGTEPGS